MAWFAAVWRHDAVMLLNCASNAGRATKDSRCGDNTRDSTTVSAAAGALFQELRDRSAVDERLVTPELTGSERQQLLRWTRSPTTPHRLVVRSHIVLLASEGVAVREISRRIRVRPAAVRRWCTRFHAGGLSAIQRDAPGRGRRPGSTRDPTVRVLCAMASRPPSGQWTARSLGRDVGLSATTVWRIWQRVGLRAESTTEEVAAVLRRVRAEGGARNF